MLPRNDRLVLAGVFLTWLNGCALLEHPKPNNRCPSSIQARPSPSQSGIKWGGGEESKVSAYIDSVAVECYPVRRLNAETDKTRVEVSTDYQIAATANVVYTVNDRKFLDQATTWHDLDASVVFEALSPSGVVLGSAQGSFRVIKGDTGGTVSAIIGGLSEEAIARVKSVEARWRYGH